MNLEEKNPNYLTVAHPSYFYKKTETKVKSDKNMKKKKVFFFWLSNEYVTRDSSKIMEK